MIILTGGAGFIGSQIGIALNRKKNIHDIIVVDSLETDQKWKNLNRYRFSDYFEKQKFLTAIKEGKFSKQKITGIFHMGACSSTTENDISYLIENNYKYSQKLYALAIEHCARFVYASSAATYGNGSAGYKDTVNLAELKPLNGYGFSKHLFDRWLENNRCGKNCAGVKFFNVFGPGEEHKGDMSSVVYKAFHQIMERGYAELFKSYKSGVEDGQQLRDFVYVKDAVETCLFLMENPGADGLFNVGSGKARSFYDLATAVFDALKIKKDIRFIEMPVALRNKYQYFTEADLSKLRSAGFVAEFPSLEENVADYVRYLEGREFL